jgi:hypothetical protein
MEQDKQMLFKAEQYGTSQRLDTTMGSERNRVTGKHLEEMVGL